MEGRYPLPRLRWVCESFMCHRESVRISGQRQKASQLANAGRPQHSLMLRFPKEMAPIISSDCIQ